MFRITASIVQFKKVRC